MSKILYPVGTKVQIRDFRIKDEEKSTGTKWSDGKRVVIEYRQGDERPYVISTVDDLSKSASKRFSVDEIKSYRIMAGSNSFSKLSDLKVPLGMNKIKEIPAPSTADVKEVVGQAVREAFMEEKAMQQERELEEQLLNVFVMETEKEPTKMDSIRQKLIYASKSKQERVLGENDILSNGYLTEQGRRVVLDLIWEGDADLRKTVYEAVLKATKKSKSKKSDCDDEE